MDRHIRTVDDALTLLDEIFAGSGRQGVAQGPDPGWWDRLYADRSRPVPFFTGKADENLARYVTDGLVAPGRALDLGCGSGRNALLLAAAGFTVDAVDLARSAVDWGRERAREAGLDISFRHGDAFRLDLTGPYDLVYDSGCLHHLPPHRRISYLALLDRVLAPGGHFGVVCFAGDPDGLGSPLPDKAFYGGHAHGAGIAYDAQALRHVFSRLDEVEIRRMHDEGADSPHYGMSTMLTALFRR